MTSKGRLANAVSPPTVTTPEFGYRLLPDELRAAEWDTSDRTVWRIAGEKGWWCSFAKPRPNRKATAPANAAHDDLVCRQFTADGPNQVLVTDLTEHRTAEGKLYFCAIKD